MIYTDLVEYNIAGDTKTSKLLCFNFVSKLNIEDITLNGRYTNYNTFGNLLFRQLLKKSFHSFQFYVEDTSGESFFILYVVITRFVLMFRKTSNIHSLRKRGYNIVASRQVKVPFNRRSGPHCGRAFAALAQVIERIAIPFLRKYIVPATKRVSADLLEFTEPDTVVVVGDRKNFETAAKSVGG